MKFIINLILLFLIAQGTFHSQTFPDKDVHDKLIDGIISIGKQDYLTAKSTFRALLINQPELPLGDIYLAAVYIAEAYDYGQEYNETLIEEHLAEARRKNEQLKKRDNNNVWYKYFEGLTEGYYSYYKALKGTWFSAVSDGLDAVTAFELCIKADQRFYEAYIAVGAYKYWRSRKMEFLSWVPFIKDEKQLGIDLLEKGIKYASYNRNLAASTLMWIYIDQKEFEKAISIADSLLVEFPSNRTFKWGKARAYEEVDPKLAIKLYNEIINSYPAGEEVVVKELWLKHIIAQQLFKIEDKRGALLLCDEILSKEKSLSNYAKSRLEERLKRVKEFRKLLD